MNGILVPLDGSPLAEAVLPMAEALARHHESPLLLLQVLSAQGSLEAETEAQRATERYLAGITGDVRTRGPADVGWRVWYGAPAAAIVQAAATLDVALIAMSTHGRGGLPRLFLGSVAETVVRTAPVPVLLLRGELPWTPGAIDRIVVPLDGSEPSEGVLRVVERLAEPLNFSIDLLSVVEPPHSYVMTEVSTRLEEMIGLRQADAEAYLTKLADVLEAKGLRARRVVRLGVPDQVIREYARDSGAGLIAMSTHGRKGLNRFFFGSVAERVLRAAPVPLLLWKAPAEQSGGTQHTD